MPQGGTTFIAVISLLLVPLAAGIGTGSTSPTEPIFTDAEQDPLLPIRRTLDTFGRTEGDASTTASMASLAQAALDFTQTPGVIDGDPVAVTRALDTLLNAQNKSIARFALDSKPSGFSLASPASFVATEFGLSNSSAGTPRIDHPVASGEPGNLDPGTTRYPPPPTAGEWANRTPAAGIPGLYRSATERSALGLAEALRIASLAQEPSIQANLARVEAITMADRFDASHHQLLEAVEIAGLDYERTPPTPPSYSSLQDALITLYGLHGIPVPSADQIGIERLSKLNETVQDQLRTLVEAHILQIHVHHSYDGDLPALTLAANLQARQMISVVLPLLPCIPGYTDTSSPVFQYDLSCEDITYEGDALLTIDLGGDDTYYNNAGGGTSVPAMLIERRGNDAYVGTSEDAAGMNGGGYLGGAGFLYDGDGSDVYNATTAKGGINGGALHGTGFLYDEGGNDKYGARLLEAGGINGGGHTGFGFLYDADGDDRYRGTVGGVNGGAVNGGAMMGNGFLFDGNGDDIYNGSAEHFPEPRVVVIDRDSGGGGVNGGANEWGSGFLWDVQGDDIYSGGLTGSGGLNGGSGTGGVGFLHDGQGMDRYEARRIFSAYAGINGGTAPTMPGTSGFLHDGAGDDRYVVRAFRGGMNGGTLGSPEIIHSGTGFLFDERGNDTYVGEEWLFPFGSSAANGAASSGIGFLFDGTGDDHYHGHGVQAAVNGGGTAVHSLANHGFDVPGSGFLYDGGGDDRFSGVSSGSGAINGAGDLLGAGFLYGGPGNDSYIGTIKESASSISFGDGAVNGGANAGVGILIDSSGSNHFIATTGPEGASNGGSRGFQFLSLQNERLGSKPILVTETPGGLGLLLAGPGDDTYTSTGTTQGAANQYGIGILIDPGGNNTYTANAAPNATNLAQGAARFGGLGLLLDNGNSTFTLDNGVTGQGVGQQGVGLALHMNEQASATFNTAPQAISGLLDGAGIGIRASLGQATLNGLQPVFTCETSPEIIGASTSLQSQLLPLPVQRIQAHLCAPDGTTSRAILNPLTGEPYAPQPKPPIPCKDTDVAGYNCEDISPDLADFLEDDEITMTTSGGSLIEYLRDITTINGQPQDGGHLKAKHTTESADRMCRHSCVEFGRGVGVAS